MQKFFPLFLLSVIAAYGDVSVPPLISDNMLLQASKSVVWGKADPGESVTVRLAGSSAAATADANGNWRVKLEGLKMGVAGPMTIEGKNRILIQNVAVGDVWLCSGQSNMEFSVSRALDAQREIDSAKFPDIRMFIVPHKASETPVEEVDGKWEVCDPATVGDWSAVGYFFARNLHVDLGIPVGMIHAPWGGTRCQAWTPSEALLSDAELKTHYWEKWQAGLAKFPEAFENYNKKTLPEWQAAAAAAKAAGQPIPRKPGEPQGHGSKDAPSSLYNGMISGSSKYPIRGVIWYQGEHNVNDPLYRKLFPAMINSWRKAWGADFPFLIVQLANFHPRTNEPADSGWAEIRDAQRLALELPNTAMAVALDIGEANDIHPKNKQEVARRLALAAEANVYEKAVISSGPLFDRGTFSGAAATVHFKRGTAIDLHTTNGGPIKGFALAGDDRKFIWADAKIVEPKPSELNAAEPYLVVTAKAVPKPIAIRYAWADNPEVNFVNKAGLPASSFRSDDWPQIVQRPQVIIPAIAQ